MLLFAWMRSASAGTEREQYGLQSVPEQRKVTGRSFRFTSLLFLVVLGLCYFAAFASMFCQLPGTLHADGLLPVKPFAKRIRMNTNWADFHEQPSLQTFMSAYGSYPSLVLGLSKWYSIDAVLDACAIAGMAVSLACVFVIPGFYLCGASQKAHVSHVMSWSYHISFAVLYLLYLSILLVGQTFFSFQWDVLLLEVGCLAIFIAPRSEDVDNRSDLSMFMVKWLLFRLMFASGIVKLTSACPTWWGLSALDHHYESQCLPTWPSWYLHQLEAVAPMLGLEFLSAPGGYQWIHQLSVTLTLHIEIILPMFLFVGHRHLEMLAAGAQALLMLLIAATGNYNWFNILTKLIAPVYTQTIGLAISAFDDQAFRYNRYRFSRTTSWDRMYSFVFLLGVVAMVVPLFYLVSFSWSGGLLNVSLAFSEADLRAFIAWSCPCMCCWAFLVFTTIAMRSVFQSVSTGGKLSLGLKSVLRLLRTVSVIGIFAFLFAASVIPFSQGIDDMTGEKYVPAAVQQAYYSHRDLHFANSYGLFRQMTTDRREVVLQVRTSPGGAWTDVEFRYKPGDVRTRPSFIIPHQPRLDWQMWFAALGTYQHNAWFVHLGVKVLTGSPGVVDLLHPSVNSTFTSQNPISVRAMSYRYSFAEPDRRSDKQRRWWTRTDGKEYLPEISLANTRILEPFLQSQGWHQTLNQLKKPKRHWKRKSKDTYREWRKSTLALVEDTPLVLMYSTMAIAWAIGMYSVGRHCFRRPSHTFPSFKVKTL